MVTKLHAWWPMID